MRQPTTKKSHAKAITRLYVEPGRLVALERLPQTTQHRARQLQNIQVSSSQPVFMKAMLPREFQSYLRGEPYRSIDDCPPSTMCRRLLFVPYWRHWVLVIGNPGSDVGARVEYSVT